jgi:hypothetical protein
MKFTKPTMPPQPRYELLSASERDAIVASHLRKHLPPLGFTQIGARTWIDVSRRPATRMFELMLLKGAAMRARWAFSLEFVPHISAGRVRRYRSEKRAMLDIIVEPSEKILLAPTFIHGAGRLHDDLNRLLPDAIEKAKDTWQRGETGRGLLNLVREIREHNTNCFPFDMYSQLPLAYAFLLARFDDLALAEQELEHYVSRLKLHDDIAEKLKALAREYASSTEGIK